MPKKTDESVACSIKNDLKSGLSQAEIAARYNVSLKTVQRIKKEIDTADMSTYEKSFIHSHHIMVPPNLQGKIDPITYYKLSLADPLEHWDVILEKGDLLRKGKSRYFAGIVYATESEFETLVKRADDLGISLGYAAHDGRDVWFHDSPEVHDEKTGTLVYAEGQRWKRMDPKKNHVHVMSYYDSAVEWSTNQYKMEEIFGLNTILWIKVGNPLRMWKYFAHDTDKARADGKFPYYKHGEIRHTINGFHIEPTKHDRELIALDIVNFVQRDLFKTFGRYEFADLMSHYNTDEYVLSVIRGNTNMLTHMIDSLRHGAGSRALDELSDAVLDELYQMHLNEINRIVAERKRRKERSTVKEDDSDGK